MNPQVKTYGTVAASMLATFLLTVGGSRAVTALLTESKLIVVEVQGEALPGRLLVLDLSKSRADSFACKVTPDTAEIAVLGKKIIFTGQPGVYSINIVGVKGGEVEMLDFPVQVPAAEPDQQEPTPDPKPEREVRGYSRVRVFVKDVATETALDKADAKKLSASFFAVADEIADTDDAHTIIAKTATANRKAMDGSDRGRDFFDELNNRLKLMQGSGQLVNADDHRLVWRQISAGLKDYSNEL